VYVIVTESDRMYCMLCVTAAVIGLRLHYLVSVSCITMGIYILLIK